MITDIGVCSIVESEQLIEEIVVRVGSGDKDASSEEPDHQDGADELRKTGSGGMYSRHAEKIVPLLCEMLLMLAAGVLSSVSVVSTSHGALRLNSNSSESLSLRVSSSSENVSSPSSLMVRKQPNFSCTWPSFVKF